MNTYEDINTAPSSHHAEQSVIGSLMLSNSGWDNVSAILCEDDFFTEDHRLIFRAISELSASKIPFDFITVSEWLTSNGKDVPMTYIGVLAKDTPSSANMCAYAEIVRDCSVKRKLISTAVSIQEKAYAKEGSSGIDLVANAQDELIALTQSVRTVESKLSTPKEMVKNLLDIWDRQQNSETDALLGLSTGFEELDNLTQGLRGGQLIIVGGRPAMGKTAFAMALERAGIDSGNPVVSFSMEMPEEQIVQRHISSSSGIPLSKVMNSRLISATDDGAEWTRLSKSAHEFSKKPYFVDDSGGQSVQSLRDSLANINNESIKEHGKPIGLVVVDYLQLMSANKNSKAGNRTESVSEFSAGLKAIAKDFNVPVVALSQLNRSLEQRPNKRPVMADLRESGSIEQDADLILFMYRDEVYNDESEDKGLGEIIIGKQRNGSLGTVRAGFDGKCTKWYDKFTKDDPSQYI